MPKEADLEFRVGAFVLAAVIAMVGFVFAVSDLTLFQGGTSYKAVFGFANGLKKGAPVRVAGVDSGHVRKLTVVRDGASTLVMADLWLASGFSLPVDSRVMINQLGLLGEKYVEVLPGTLPEFFPPGAVLIGEDPVAMEDLLAMVHGLADQAETVLDNVNSRFLTEANARTLAAALQNVEAVTASLREGQGSAGQFLMDPALYRNLLELTEALKEGRGTAGKFLMDPGVYRNLEELTADLKANPWKLFYRPKQPIQPREPIQPRGLNSAGAGRP